MTDAQTNQETEEAYVTLTTEPPIVQQQSSSISLDLVAKFINPTPDTGIDSILNLNVAVSVTPSSATIIPQTPILIIQPQQKTHDSTTITIPTKIMSEIPNFASLFSFERRVSSLESDMSALKQTNQFPEALSSILGIVDKYLVSKVKDTVVTLKRGRDDQDKDEEPSAGSNRGSKRQRSDKEESSKEALKASQVYMFLLRNVDGSPVREATDIDERLWNPSGSLTPDREWNQTKTLDWHNPDGRPYPHDLSKPLPLIPDARGHQIIPYDHFINNDLEYLKGGSSSLKYTTSITKTKAADYGHVKWIEDKIPRSTWSEVQVVYDKHAYWGTYHWGPKHQRFYGYATNLETSKDVYSKHRIIDVTKGNFKRLRRKDIEDMLLLLVQERVEDLQLAVESYQKKINLTKPNTYWTDLKKMTPYTAYRDIQGIIYQDDMDRNCLMRTDELHKFNDNTLNHVRTSLNDIATGIQIEYLPKRKWTKQDKREPG
ncbi:hypothetical protein Tco_0490760 [Tanacetum coccineum]